MICDRYLALLFFFLFSPVSPAFWWWGFPIPVFFADTSQAAEKSLDELKSLKTTTEAQIGSGRAPLCPLTWGQPQGIFLS